MIIKYRYQKELLIFDNQSKHQLYIHLGSTFAVTELSYSLGVSNRVNKQI